MLAGTRTCKRCGTEFKPRTRTHAYCRRECVNPSTYDRIMAHVVRRGACWILTRGGEHSFGYVWTSHRGRKILAHRYMWEWKNGRPVPEGLIVRHSCDTPPCVNPAHLSVGTTADNVKDRVDRNRTRHGSRHGAAKLTEADVRVIRGRQSAGDPDERIARDFGVSRATLYKIKTQQTWKHVN